MCNKCVCVVFVYKLRVFVYVVHMCASGYMEVRLSECLCLCVMGCTSVICLYMCLWLFPVVRIGIGR